MSTTIPDVGSLDSYLKKLEDPTRQVENSKLNPRSPITTVEISEAWMPFSWQIMHRPNSVVMVNSITDTVSTKVWTVLAGEVFHYGSAKTLPNFPAETIKPGETVEKAALRGVKEELPALNTEWIKEISCLGYGYNSVGSSTEQTYIAHVRSELPEGILVQDLNGQSGGLEAEGERIKTQIEELTPELESKLCGLPDKYALMKVLSSDLGGGRGNRTPEI